VRATRARNERLPQPPGGRGENVEQRTGPVLLSALLEERRGPGRQHLGAGPSIAMGPVGDDDAVGRGSPDRTGELGPSARHGEVDQDDIGMRRGAEPTQRVTVEERAAELEARVAAAQVTERDEHAGIVVARGDAVRAEP